MNYTKGEWEATDYVMMDGKRRYDIETVEEVIATDVGEADSHLIVSAVNACASVNPDNPIVVAESIKAMYEALKLAEKALPYTSNERGIVIEALASADGK